MSRHLTITLKIDDEYLADEGRRYLEQLLNIPNKPRNQT